MNIEQAISYFDFHRVKIAMEALDWIWGHENEPMKVPSIEYMKETVRYLYDSALDGFNIGVIPSISETDGFRVIIRSLEDVYIEFILEEI